MILSASVDSLSVNCYYERCLISVSSLIRRNLLIQCEVDSPYFTQELRKLILFAHLMASHSSIMIKKGGRKGRKLCKFVDNTFILPKTNLLLLTPTPLCILDSRRPFRNFVQKSIVIKKLPHELLFFWNLKFSFKI